MTQHSTGCMSAGERQRICCKMHRHGVSTLRLILGSCSECRAGGLTARRTWTDMKWPLSTCAQQATAVWSIKAFADGSNASRSLLHASQRIVMRSIQRIIDPYINRAAAAVCCMQQRRDCHSCYAWSTQETTLTGWLQSNIARRTIIKSRCAPRISKSDRMCTDLFRLQAHWPIIDA